jgi:DNA-binding NarL/FixJ family response regulator
MPRRHAVLALVVAICWAVNFVVIDIGLESFPPLLFAALRFATGMPKGLDELSPRELEVLGFVARGSTNREIADALYLSPLTVKTHVSRILMKLRTRDRVQLVVIAYQAGLVA